MGSYSGNLSRWSVVHRALLGDVQLRRPVLTCFHSSSPKLRWSSSSLRLDRYKMDASRLLPATPPTGEQMRSPPWCPRLHPKPGCSSQGRAACEQSHSLVDSGCLFSLWQNPSDQAQAVSSAASDGAWTGGGGMPSHFRVLVSVKKTIRPKRRWLREATGWSAPFEVRTHVSTHTGRIVVFYTYCIGFTFYLFFLVIVYLEFLSCVHGIKDRVYLSS
jgi:hypothetical protein